MNFSNEEGFTLVEVLVSVAIISVVATVIFVAIDPAERFAEARNAARWQDTEAILDAVKLYQVDNNGEPPSGVDSTLRMVGTAGSGCDISCGAGVAPGGQSLTDDGQLDFDSGTYNDTQWNGVENWVDLTVAGFGNGFGSYVSEITDVGNDVTWDSIAWVPERPTGKELPDNAGVETAYNTGNADMTGNVLMMHMDDVSGSISDTSPESNDGSANGGVTYANPGKINQALGFDGVDDYVSIPNDSSLDVRGGDFAFAAWARLDGKTTDGTLLAKTSAQALTSQDQDNYGGQTFSVAVDGNVLASADTTGSGVNIFDVSTPSNPSSVFTDTFSAGGVDLDGGYAYVTDYNNALLKIYDVSNLGSVSFVNQVSVGSFPVPVEVRDGYAYVQEFSGSNMYIVDVSNPASPTVESTISLTATTPYGNGVKVIDNTMFVATADGNVTIYNVSNPASPSQIQQYSYTGGPELTGIDVDNNYIYIGDYTNNRLSILNNPCSDFVTPTCGATWQEVGDNTDNAGYIRPRYVEIDDDFLFMARHANPGAIQVYDVSDRTNPQLIGTDGVFNGPNAVEAAGGYAYSGLNTGAVHTHRFDPSAIDLRYDNEDDQWVFGVREGGNWSYAKYNQSSPNTGEWYHVAGVRDGGNLRIYVNGEQGNITGSVASPGNISPGTVSVGRFGSFDSKYYNGLIDEVSIWGRAISTTEAGDFYKRGALRLRFQVRSCDDNACSGEVFAGPDGTSGTYFEWGTTNFTSPPSFTFTNVPDNRYFQYKTDFETDDGTLSPELNSVTVDYSGTAGGVNTDGQCIDLSGPLAAYLGEIPQDPKDGSSGQTQYAIQTIGGQDIVQVTACNAELSEQINVQR